MKRIFVLSFLGILIVATSASCIKEGCTDPTAKNYSSEASKNDGTCQYNPKVEVKSIDLVHISDTTVTGVLWDVNSAPDCFVQLIDDQGALLHQTPTVTDVVSGATTFTFSPEIEVEFAGTTHFILFDEDSSVADTMAYFSISPSAAQNSLGLYEWIFQKSNGGHTVKIIVDYKYP